MRRRYPFIRNDYGAVYEGGGVDALNRLLVERYPDPEIRDAEVRRMKKRGPWIIGVDDQNGVACILGRKPAS
jgi:hypothetical protein